MRKFISLSTAVSVAIFSLTGCGGSSDSTTASANGTQTGYFIDAEVTGLNYKTSSGKVGKTNTNGQFFYKAGESVSFSIGNLQLGKSEPKADGLITPQHLAQNSAKGNQEKAAQVENLMLRLLQSADIDNNPENGISISPRLSEKLNKINKTHISEMTEATLLDLDAELRSEIDENNDGVIDVAENDAKKHADKSRSDWDKGTRPQKGDHGKDQNTDNTAKSELTNDQKYSLAYMWNEERLAKDIYLALNELYPSKQFENIANKSEVKHIAAVEGLVKKYDINILNLVDYTVNYTESELRALPAGTYAVESVQTLYDELYAKGKLSKIDALQTACMVEVTDVDDLDKFINIAKEVNATDLVTVYDKLRAGSYNHYWAFDSALKAEGVSDGCASLGSDFAKTKAEYPSSHDGKAEQGNTESNTNTENSDTTQTTNEGSALTNDQKYSLAYMWNEERLAKDIYLALNDLYPAKQFENIANKSEVKHIDAVEGLVQKYDINILNLIDYTVNYSETELRALPAGTYGVDSVQKLYDDLYAKGQKSKVDALQVACMVEVTDVDDLDLFIEVAEKVHANDLISVYEKLRAGSYNHYWVFDKALKNEGVTDGCASLGAEFTKTTEEYPSNQSGG